MGLAVVSIILLSGSLKLNDIVADQQGYLFSWNVFKQPVAFIIFLIAVYGCSFLFRDFPNYVE